MEIVHNISSIAGLLSLLVSLIIWLKVRYLDRQSEMVDIRFSTASLAHPQKEFIDVKMPLSRAEVCRAEVLGRLGMLVKDGARMSVRDLKTPAFMASISNARSGKTDTIDVRVSPDELEQFELIPSRFIRR